MIKSLKRLYVVEDLCIRMYIQNIRLFLMIFILDFEYLYVLTFRY